MEIIKMQGNNMVRVCTIYTLTLKKNGITSIFCFVVVKFKHFEFIAKKNLELDGIHNGGVHVCRSWILFCVCLLC